MREFFVSINPNNASQAEEIVNLLKEQGTIPAGAEIYVRVDRSVLVTVPPSAKVEEIFAVDGCPVDNVQITS